MQVTTERLENCIVKLTIELDERSTNSYLQRAARALSRQYRLPGFRPGKAPYGVVVQRLGIESESEPRVFGRGFNFFHPENWYSAHSLIEYTLKLSGLYWRGRRNTLDIRVRTHDVPIRGLPAEFDGFSLRVPTPTVSVVDFTAELEKDATAEELNAAFTAAAEGPMKGILGVETQKLVSMDFNHNPASSTFALDQTHVTDGTLVRVLSWYDNEYGYTCNMLRFAKHVAAN